MHRVNFRKKGAVDHDECWVIDRDFDDLGGPLTFAQICDPQAELYKPPPTVREPGEWMPMRPRKKYKAAKVVVRPDYECRHCIPYNGRHTAGYWNTGQEDIW